MQSTGVNAESSEKDLNLPDSDEQETPWDLFNAAETSWGAFEIDVCATAKNTKVPSRYFSLEEGDNALRMPWLAKRVWMNPPYSRGNLEKFCRKAYEESLLGCTVVGLLKDDRSTEWWDKWVRGKVSEIVELRKRVHFNGSKGSPNFPSVIVVWRPPFKWPIAA